VEGGKLWAKDKEADKRSKGKRGLRPSLSKN
jgi:hypothetical protein